MDWRVGGECFIPRSRVDAHSSRWLYIIEGSGTVLAGLLAIVLLPDFPNLGKQSWLTEQEQRLAVWRLARAANNEVDENGSIKQGLKDAVTDYKTWMLVLLQVCLLTSQSWTYFFPVSSNESTPKPKHGAYIISVHREDTRL